MKVGIVTDAFPPTVGGMETYARNFVEELASSDAVSTIEVLAFDPSPDEALDSNPRLRVERSGKQRSVERWWVGIDWLRRRGSFDALHALTLYPAGVLAVTARLARIASRTFVTIHGTDALSVLDHMRHRWIRSFILSNVDGVFFNSDSTREKVVAAYGSVRSPQTVYPGTPAVEEPDPQGPDVETSASLIVLTVTRLVQRKGIEDLIEAVSTLPEVDLWIVGDGPERESLERLAQERDAEDQVHFFGQVPNRELATLYAQCDVFSLPSRHLESAGDVEGLGLVSLEAQQFGTPVIGTDSGGIPETIEDGETGFVVSERSPESINEVIEDLLSDPELLDELSQKAKETVERRFSWNQSIAQHVAAYCGERQFNEDRK